MFNGVVVRATSHLYQVAVDDRLLMCSLRGRLKREQQKVTNLLAVGDRVSVTELNQEQGVIEGVAERRSKLSRLSPGRGGHFEQILVTNVDYIVIVMAAYKPDFNLRRLDRFLVAANDGNCTPVLCINKIDLVPRQEVEPELEIYVSGGLRVLYTSAQDGTGIDELAALLQGSVSALVGSSGVGKSSLINAVDPGLGLRTKQIRERFYKGSHTTTSAELLSLEQGGYVVDTPGLREFGLWHKADKSVADAFEEFEDYAENCRFRNCTHTHEPGCAVRAAVEAGEIDEDRYISYAKLHRPRRSFR